MSRSVVLDYDGTVTETVAMKRKTCRQDWPA